MKVEKLLLKSILHSLKYFLSCLFEHKYCNLTNVLHNASVKNMYKLEFIIYRKDVQYSIPSRTDKRKQEEFLKFYIHTSPIYSAPVPRASPSQEHMKT